MKRACLVAILVAVFSACGGEGPKAPAYNGRHKDAGAGEDVDAAVSGDPAKPTTGPLVEFTAPMPAPDAASENVLMSREVTVRCSVKQRSGIKAGIDRSSVKITLDTGTAVQGATVEALPNDEYEAKFDVAALPNGALRFKCEAKDLQATPASASKTLETLLDLGPKITVSKPSKMIAALQTPVAIEFQVDPAPLADGDDGAAVKNVQLQASGLDFPVTEVEGKPGLYQTSIPFGDTTLFPQAPTFSQIVITAENARKPVAGKRSIKFDLDIDAGGPKIVVTSPANAELKHGTVTLLLDISDPSGIEPGSVHATINNTLLVIDDWQVKGNVYSQTFDTMKFGPTLTELTINVAARDTVGNESKIGHTIRLDNVPPLLSLDPPWIREWRQPASDIFCSAAFDPVGDAASDQDPVEEGSVYRVLVEDQTNMLPGAKAAYFAGVAPESVQLYMQPKAGVPLLVDTDDNGICDRIYEDPDNRPEIIPLTPLASRGASWFPKPDAWDAVKSGAPAQCKPDPAGQDLASAPKNLCSSTAMTRVVAGRLVSKPPAVYALHPTNTDNGACEGEAWDLFHIMNREGWVCVAATAKDTVGNVGISEAIRVCVDSATIPGSPCSDPPPNCNKNCRIDPSQRYPANDLWEVR